MSKKHLFLYDKNHFTNLFIQSKLKIDDETSLEDYELFSFDNKLKINKGNTEIFNFSSNNNFCNKLGILKTPSYELDVNGNINFTGGLLKNGSSILSPFEKNNNNIYFNGGNVGIGTNTPSSLLHIESNINPTLTISNSNTTTNQPATIQLGTTSSVGAESSNEFWYPVDMNANSINYTNNTFPFKELNGNYIASTSSFLGTNDVYNVFDTHPSYNTFWTSGIFFDASTGLYNGSVNLTGDYAGEWVKIELPRKVKINSYRIATTSTSVQRRSPRDWRVVGSNDNINWTTIDTKSVLIITQSTFTYSVSPTESFKYYAFIVSRVGWSEVHSTDMDRCNLSTFQVKGYGIITGGSFSKIISTSTSTSNELSISIGNAGFDYETLNIDFNKNISTFGDFNVNNLLYVKNNKVGVNNDNPLALLDIKIDTNGELLFFDIQREWGFRTTDSGTSTKLRLYNNVDNKYFNIIEESSGNYLSRFYSSSTTSNHRVVFFENSNAAGRLGIRTNNPTEMVEVNGNIKTSGRVLSNSFTRGHIVNIQFDIYNNTITMPANTGFTTIRSFTYTTLLASSYIFIYFDGLVLVNGNGFDFIFTEIRVNGNTRMRHQSLWQNAGGGGGRGNPLLPISAIDFQSSGVGTSLTITLVCSTSGSNDSLIFYGGINGAAYCKVMEVSPYEEFVVNELLIS